MAVELAAPSVPQGPPRPVAPRAIAGDHEADVELRSLACANLVVRGFEVGSVLSGTKRC